MAILIHFKNGSSDGVSFLSSSRRALASCEMKNLSLMECSLSFESSKDVIVEAERFLV